MKSTMTGMGTCFLCLSCAMQCVAGYFKNKQAAFSHRASLFSGTLRKMSRNNLLTTHIAIPPVYMLLPWIHGTTITQQ